MPADDEDPRDRHAPAGFAFHLRGAEVLLTHRGRRATTLRGEAALRFLEEAQGLDPLAAQHLMARLTGQYRRGNERLARQHPRNRGR